MTVGFFTFIVICVRLVITYSQYFYICFGFVDLATIFKVSIRLKSTVEDASFTSKQKYQRIGYGNGAVIETASTIMHSYDIYIQLYNIASKSQSYQSSHQILLDSQSTTALPACTQKYQYQYQYQYHRSSSSTYTSTQLSIYHCYWCQY